MRESGVTSEGLLQNRGTAQRNRIHKRLVGPKNVAVTTLNWMSVCRRNFKVLEPNTGVVHV